MAENSKFEVSLRLLIDSECNKVIFAVVGKDFVDYLFNLNSLPVSTAICFPNTHSVAGSLGNLCESFENINKTLMQPNQTKDSLLAYDVARQVYMCPKCNCNVTSGQCTLCRLCGVHLSNELDFGAPDVEEGVSAYIVMDDLAVKPMSALSFINSLNKFNIKGVGALEERVVHLGINEVLKLLKVSLHSKSVLTSVFLYNEGVMSSSATSCCCLGNGSRVGFVMKKRILFCGKMMVCLFLFIAILDIGFKGCFEECLIKCF
ncbi:hypothetical protein like AT5G01130 [Hibiscus trionum]|uniref:Uncharacterized protein n=1 Tax=Hibiscus trionum TaxID=183268 RepID=A0A9W7M410_HIBTR|nr:hypothetical protein like AT5G01130 [Hibiscus trionum]